MAQFERLQAERGLDVGQIQGELEAAERAYRAVRARAAEARERLELVVPDLVRQLLRLQDLRERCEKEVRDGFERAAKPLGAGARLKFELPALPTLEARGLRFALADRRLAARYAAYRAQEARQLPVPRGQIKLAGEDRGAASYSGGEATFAALCFLTACARVVQAAYLQVDEWDVYMDSARRRRAFALLADVLLHTLLQAVLVTPNDVDLDDPALGLAPAQRALIGVVRLASVVRR